LINEFAKLIGRRGSPGKQLVVAIIAIASLSSPNPFGKISFGQDAISIANSQEDRTFEFSREEWRERVAEAKRRSWQYLDRVRSASGATSTIDEAQIASGRVRNDSSLQTGDIVSTNKSAGRGILHRAISGISA
jgi:hypothetical protein